MLNQMACLVLGGSFGAAQLGVIGVEVANLVIMGAKHNDLGCRTGAHKSQFSGQSDTAICNQGCCSICTRGVLWVTEASSASLDE